ncbi:MAG: NUDIX hydrolase [Anaerolineae bacterium]|jgi:ADP-ribose pyrophosphatase|nr:NUDIX hydrolase [Anaerolineae bacterium]
MNEIIENTEAIYDGRIVKLALHTVRLPDGQLARREVITHPGAVAVVALDDQGCVLLVRQFRSAARQTMLEIPAGTLYPGEDPLTCAIRELREETGYRPQRIEPMGGIHAAPGYTTEYIHLFYATDLEAAPLRPDADEFLEVTRLPLAAALALIDDGGITDSKTSVGLLRVARRQSHTSI